MARYIDVNKLKERIEVSPAFPNMGMDGYFLRDVVLNLIDKQPSVEVVRCKDCTQCYHNPSLNTFRCGRFMAVVDPNHFCSYGERKSK